MTAEGVTVRPLGPSERTRLRELLTREWGSAEIISRGKIHDATKGPALGCWDGRRLVGLATYTVIEDECELLTLNAFEPGVGAGSALLGAVIDEARRAGCRRVWLTTSNDNARAIGFYESRGMRLVAVHHGALDEARKIKPEIPEYGPDGTRISDEMEFELEL